MGKNRSGRRRKMKKSLYICSIELKEEVISYVIHGIKLSVLLKSPCSCCRNPTDGEEPVYPRCMICNNIDFDLPRLEPPSRPKCSTCSEKNSELRYLASAASDDLPVYMGCGVFGSQIIFAGGINPRTTPHDLYLRMDLYPDFLYARFGPDLSTAVYGFETDLAFEQKSEIIVKGGQSLNQMFEEKPPLKAGSFRPLLVELKGKLYALSRYFGECNMKPPYFQVFDPEAKEWSGLREPPIFHPNDDYYVGESLYTSCTIVDTKILVSTALESPAFGFDVAQKKNPQRQWQTEKAMFRDGLPFSETALVVEDEDETFMFTYEFYMDEYTPNNIVVYLVSNESMETVTTLELSGLPYEFWSSYYYSFVHVGGRKVCFILTAYPPDAEVMRVVVITLELGTKTKGVSRDIKIVATRFFDCNTQKSHESHTRYAHLLGCFVL